MPTSAAPIRENAYYADGSIQWRGFKLNGEMHGDWEFFRKDGSLMRSGSFASGRQVGTWRTFDRSGALIKETEFTANPNSSSSS